MGQDMTPLTLLPIVDTLSKHGIPECLWSVLWPCVWFCGPNAGVVYKPENLLRC